jgi:TatA/E family protein of Tat protein translocase
MGIESPVHLLFLAAVALIVLGPKRLPALAKALGQGIREFRESLTDGALQDHPVERQPALAPGQVVQAGQMAAPAAMHADAALAPSASPVGTEASIASPAQPEAPIASASPAPSDPPAASDLPAAG